MYFLHFNMFAVIRYSQHFTSAAQFRKPAPSNIVYQCDPLSIQFPLPGLLFILPVRPACSTESSITYYPRPGVYSISAAYSQYGIFYNIISPGRYLFYQCGLLAVRNLL